MRSINRALQLAATVVMAGSLSAAGGCNGVAPPVAPAVSGGQTGLPGANRAQRPNTASSLTFKRLYSFKGAPNDGAYPDSLTVLNGAIYGTTRQGGNGSCDFVAGCGSVFTIQSGREKMLYSFQGLPNDGWSPGPSSMIALNSTLYGTTSVGGNGGCKNIAGNLVGCGTVFSITASGQEKVLYNFQGGQDGAYPDALILVNGVLYGTTQQGGSNGCGGFGCGSVFSLTTSGQEKIVYSFGTFTDGNYPSALISVKGKFYGTTFQGGYCIGTGTGCGTFFSLTKSGRERILYEFQGYSQSDGAGPQGALINVNGTVYGVTSSGGSGGLGFCDSPLGECGTVYSITTSGQEHVLHSFGGPYGDGSWPLAGLIAVKNVLYGTTYEGGNGARNYACHDRYGYPVGCGTVFSINASGQESVFYSFSGAGDGGYPDGRLVAVKGRLYGTATLGGTKNFGTVFKL